MEKNRIARADPRLIYHAGARVCQPNSIATAPEGANIRVALMNRFNALGTAEILRVA